ncbi:MAG: ABC transporter permease [Candidimonas sp.]|nr:MAG: ABC transporter permease [Candidimonas sp.]TAM25655.1 MAG: ABC transporter permease [Candidimonas sp.]
MIRSHNFNNGLVFLTPAALLLAVVFLWPLIWFFVHTLTTSGGLTEVVTRASAIIKSKAVITALTTTNSISLLVTALVLVISYPLAYYLTNHRGFRFTLVLFCIIVPYFTSIIVRTYSWMVLLGWHGIINQVLLHFGIIDQPLTLLYSKTGVLIGMVYVLLPYMILTLFAAMKTIDPSLMRAARGLGASPFYSFTRIYFPLSVHGVISGSLIVFIVAIGFFITPTLMGGPKDVMIVMLIERSVEITYDWFGAAVMSLLLLVVTLVLYGIYYRVTDVRRMMGA